MLVSHFNQYFCQFESRIVSKNIENWFTEWFDSYHYHLLYDHRDDQEAERFIRRLFMHLDLVKGSKVLDLACGKGRHAKQVHELGYNVLGIDLSEESIEFAKQYEEEGLEFTKADMRHLDLSQKFDITLNLFTSFGYFEKDQDDRAVLEGLAKHLKPNGRIVLDYLNVSKVRKQLPVEEIIAKHDLSFHTRKAIDKNFIVKDIEFEDQGLKNHYREYVKLLELSDFTKYFNSIGMKIEETFGNYELDAFSPTESDRLIMIAKFN